MLHTSLNSERGMDGQYLQPIFTNSNNILFPHPRIQNYLSIYQGNNLMNVPLSISKTDWGLNNMP